jgi:signal peptidase II
MKPRMNFILSIIACISLFIVDRASKLWALSLDDDVFVNQFLSFHLAFNRGISWGFFDSTDSLPFLIVSGIVFALVTYLLWYTIQRYRSGYSIIGELLVLTGAFSNIFDRLQYQGVIDFILLSYKNYYWPLFNIADALIVLGVFIMVMEIVHEPQ